VDNIESLDPTTCQFHCMTLWENKKAVERYDDSLFHEVAQALTPFLVDEPLVRTMTVENSSIHHIKAGMAAA
jgi:hypothetical protein